MKARITFEVEPHTTYVYEVHTWDAAIVQGHELARVMRRKSWKVECDGTTRVFEHAKAPTVQLV